MANIATFEPGTTQLLMGNEAIARGALEAGIGFAAAYPGTPSSEIIGTLAEVAKDAGIYVEWSVNEKVALEAAAAASFAGVRSIVAMKQNGLNVALDFLMGLGTDGDQRRPGPRHLRRPRRPVQHRGGGLAPRRQVGLPAAAGAGHLPGREGHDPLGLRAVGGAEDRLPAERRDAHLARPRRRRIGERLPPVREAKFEPSIPLEFTSLPAPLKHGLAHQKMDKAREIFEDSPFNWYQGPEKPDLLIVTCGSGWFYSLEAVKALELEKSGRHPQAGHHLAPAREAGPRAPGREPRRCWSSRRSTPSWRATSRSWSARTARSSSDTPRRSRSRRCSPRERTSG